MANNVLQKFDELFKDLDNMSMDKVEALVHESLKFFELLKGKLQSPDEAERKEAQELAQELQKKLEMQAEKAYLATGLGQSELDSFLNSPQNFSQDEWGVLERTQKELSEYQSSLLKNGKTPSGEEGKPKKVKRISLNKIQG